MADKQKMDIQKLSLILGFAALVLFGYLVSKLAGPCEGRYSFSFKEANFVCEEVSTQRDLSKTRGNETTNTRTTPIASENGTSTETSIPVKEDPCDGPWQKKPRDCPK